MYNFPLRCIVSYEVRIYQISRQKDACICIPKNHVNCIDCLHLISKSFEFAMTGPPNESTSCFLIRTDPRVLEPNAFRRLHVLAIRGLHTLTFRGLHVLAIRGRRTLTLRGLHVLAIRGLHALTSRGLHVLALRGLHAITLGTSYPHRQRTTRSRLERTTRPHHQRDARPHL